MASVGSILGGAIRLLRDRPGSIAIWAITYLLGSVLATLAFGLLVMGTAMPFAPPTTMEPPVPSFGTFWAIALVYLAFLLLMLVLMNAVFRAVLWPGGRRGFASMQLGMDELRMLGLVLLVGVVSFVAMVVVQLLLLFLASLITFASGGNGTVAAGLSLVLMIACLCAFVWIATRLSVLFPLTLYRRRISIDAAWELTRGRFWTLFLSYLVIWLALIAGWIVVMSFFMGDYFVAVMQAAGDQQRVEMAYAEFARHQFEMPILERVAVTILFAVLAVISIVIGPGVQASATRELLIERGEMLESEEDSGAAAPDWSGSDQE